MEKVHVKGSYGENVEIGVLGGMGSDVVGINITDTMSKSEWVCFSVEKAKEIKGMLDKCITQIESKKR